jgi:hypothetical protein
MEITTIDSTQITEPVMNSIQWIPINRTISLIALTLGIAIFVISYFAGGKENNTKSLFSICFAVLIGFFSFPLFIKAGEWLGIMNSGYGKIAIITLVMIFVAAIATNIYEIVTVTAREARPPK